MGFLLPFLKKLPSSLGKLLIRLHAKQNLRSVPKSCYVLRLGREPKDFKEKGQVSAIQLKEEFSLSPADRESTPPHLSVWANALTTPEQAYSFLPTGSPRKLVLRLAVKAIRDIAASSVNKELTSHLLDVKWVHLTQEINGRQVRDPRIGSKGHAGIIGLDDQCIPDKILRKNLRFELAELASKECWLLDSFTVDDGKQGS